MSEFLFSPVGVIARHRWRQMQRATAIVRGIEPAAKHSMPIGDKLAFQQAIVDYLARQRRRPFVKPLALQLSLHTTGRNPTQLHNVGKNLMDLLGTPLPWFRGRRGILYYDDSQVHALSISCRHEVPQSRGENHFDEDCGWDLEGPRISLTAVRHSLYMEDLAAGAEAERHIKLIDREWETREDAVAEYRRMLDKYDEDRVVLGRERHTLEFEMAAREAQQRILSSSGLSLGVLARLHRASAAHGCGLSHRVRGSLRDTANASLPQSQTRMMLGELPVRSGESAAFRELVTDRLEAFWGKWEWLFGDRLRIPVALEVLVKPPFGASADALHDLDNVVKSYLVKPIVARLQPPIEFALGVNPEHFRDGDARLPTWLERSIQAVPKNVRVGLTRYEVWRIPRVAEDKEPGFVSVGLVSDLSGSLSSMSRADIAVNEWSRRLREACAF